MKKQKGITLIALIITIIVMLILVAVTINVALNGGIFSRAKEATEKTQIEADKESLLMAAMTCIGEDGKVDFTKLNTEATKLGFSGSNGTYSKGGYTYIVNKTTGKVTLAGTSTSEDEEETLEGRYNISFKSDEDLIAINLDTLSLEEKEYIMAFEYPNGDSAYIMFNVHYSKDGSQVSYNMEFHDDNSGTYEFEFDGENSGYWHAEKDSTPLTVPAEIQNVRILSISEIRRLSKKNKFVSIPNEVVNLILNITKIND